MKTAFLNISLSLFSSCFSSCLARYLFKQPPFSRKTFIKENEDRRARDLTRRRKVSTRRAVQRHCFKKKD